MTKVLLQQALEALLVASSEMRDLHPDHPAMTIVDEAVLAIKVAIVQPAAVNLQLIAVLRGGRQCDEDGAEIIMSRQACWEAADILEGLAQPVQPAPPRVLQPGCGELTFAVNIEGEHRVYSSKCSAILYSKWSD